MKIEYNINLLTVLFVLFLALKLTGHIAWSWWWVFAPLWLPYALLGFVCFVGLIILGIVAFVTGFF